MGLKQGQERAETSQIPVHLELCCILFLKNSWDFWKYGSCLQMSYSISKPFLVLVETPARVYPST